MTNRRKKTESPRERNKREWAEKILPALQRIANSPVNEDEVERKRRSISHLPADLWIGR